MLNPVNYKPLILGFGISTALRRYLGIQKRTINLTVNNDHILKEARTLLDARWHSSNDTLRSSIEDWVMTLLQPLAEDGVPQAQYLFDAIIEGSSATQTEEEFDQQYLKRLKKGAQAEIPDAMFYLAHRYWKEGNHDAAAPLYKKAALSGHAYAKWCYGLDLIAGTGVARDEAEGLKQIEEAARLKFEGAIQFMANVYALGQYGYAKDEAQAATWQRLLGSDELIGF